jgi:hypothetical protein
MSISETASKNHEALFPNRKSKLAETDPELIGVFDNFAFDEVLGYGNLAPIPGIGNLDWRLYHPRQQSLYFVSKQKEARRECSRKHRKIN